MLKTNDQFLVDARLVWGDKYDLSECVYVGSKEYVSIICRKHGRFRITPNNFLRGHGCPRCRIEAIKKPIYGVGINDIDFAKKDPAWVCWHSMLQRGYSGLYKRKYPAYTDCSVCEEWHYFSKFKLWYDKNYRKGYSLDKDILEKGNRVYCPEKCCFVPPQINAILIGRALHRGKFPIGVTITRTGKYRAELSIKGKGKILGYYNTEDDAFAAYKHAKESYIKEMAREYYEKGLITERVRDALFRYEVEITD